MSKRKNVPLNLYQPGAIRRTLVASIVLCLAATAAQADFFLVRNIDLTGDFGSLGTNPMTLTFDGAYAYVGGYVGWGAPRDIGILKINIWNPVDKSALEPGGTQRVNLSRFYDGLVVKEGVLYALTDRPLDTEASTNVRAIDVNTGGLVATFGGNSGTNGILVEPAGLGKATGGMAFDPGFGGAGSGLSLLKWASGRRHLIDIADGTTIYDSSNGMIVTDLYPPGNCIVADASAWRDHVYDDEGNVYMRRTNQVQEAHRSGGNGIGGYEHLTDELNADGSPKEGCGDGKPVALRVAPYVIGQHLALIKGTSAGANEDLIIFNDRWSSFSQGNRSFADTIKIINTNGLLPDLPVELLHADGEPLSSNGAPNGVGLYDFHYDAAEDVLLILDFANRNLLVFSGVQSCYDPPQDADGDGDVDVSDFLAFEECLNGPNQPWPGPPVNQAYCSCVDRDYDSDVDLVDWAEMQSVFGP